MPYAIDEEKLNSTDLKVLDISQPPMKAIAHQEFPRMVYLHPVDKTREHRTKIVADLDALESAQKQGWKLQPHVPSEPPDAEIEAGDFEIASQTETKRGPGRPRGHEAA